jgi:hypothetical protein
MAAEFSAAVFVELRKSYLRLLLVWVTTVKFNDNISFVS